MTNLLPAVLLAATPHNGKSVLAHLLSRELRNRRIPHILLRTAPDGEGDWFYESQDIIRLRLRRKGTFNDRLVTAMRRAIQNRRLPMLVDIGGRPQGSQFNILSDCTHVIHLFRDERDRAVSGAWLEPLNLIPIAELRSQLTGADLILEDNGLLRGVITGLDRTNPHRGHVFARLVERVAGIFTYSDDELLALHRQEAPSEAELLTDTQLATWMNAFTADGGIRFEPTHLASLPTWLSQGQSVALYGRLPLWLVAAIAVLTMPAPLYWFDARHYGWMKVPTPRWQSAGSPREFTLTPQAEGEAIRLVFALKPGIAVLAQRRSLGVPRLSATAGILLDGPMPAWLAAALARAYHRHPWLAVREPRLGERGDIRFWPLC
jgi:CRISPR-associated protein Csx3